MDYQWKDCNSSDIVDEFHLRKDADFKYALIQINIKNFRYYNIKYGIEDGNEILELVFQGLKSFFQEDEYVGHFYADNFVVLARYEDVELLVRERLVDLIDKLYRIQDQRIYRNLFFSVGIYQMEDKQAGFQEAWNGANLCRKESDELNQRCTSIEVYGDDFYHGYTGRMELENKTADAYKNYEFITYLQPKVSLEDEKVIGAEALLRWFDQDGNCMPLYKYLPILNQNGYIVLVDLDIFDQVCQYLDRRIKNNQKVVPISFNISNAYFYTEDLEQDYIDIYEKYEIPKEYIEFEFMESISLDDTQHMKKVMSRFKEYGFKCVLDDFGNGYSSFNVLLNAPLDIVKLDRQFFLQNLRGDSRLVIQTVVDLIHSLNMKVVAEGVEEKEHIEFLKACGCDYVQGYYYYKPMPADQFEALLDQE